MRAISIELGHEYMKTLLLLAQRTSRGICRFRFQRPVKPFVPSVGLGGQLRRIATVPTASLKSPTHIIR